MAFFGSVFSDICMRFRFSHGTNNVHHLPADRTGLLRGEIAVVTLFQVDADFVRGFHLELVEGGFCCIVLHLCFSCWLSPFISSRVSSVSRIRLAPPRPPLLSVSIVCRARAEYKWEFPSQDGLFDRIGDFCLSFSTSFDADFSNSLPPNLLQYFVMYEEQRRWTILVFVGRIARTKN